MKKAYGLIALIAVLLCSGVVADAKNKSKKTNEEEIPLVRCRKCAKRYKCSCKVNLRKKQVRLGDDCAEYIAKHGHAKPVNCPHEEIVSEESENE